MLTDSEKTDFFDRGWFVRRQQFSSVEIETMKRCFTSLETKAQTLCGTELSDGAYFVLDEKDGEQVIKRVVWAGGTEPELLAIGNDERLTRPAADLLGSSAMEQLLSQAHFKRPHDGVTFGWHQDIQHRDKGNDTWSDLNGRGSFVQTLIAIDDMTADSGPLQFIAGTGNIGAIGLDGHHYEATSEQLSDVPFDPSNAVTIDARAGDVVFFGPYAIHASFENTSSEYRRVFINGYAYPGANKRQYPGDGAGRLITVNDV